MTGPATGPARYDDVADFYAAGWTDDLGDSVSAGLLRLLGPAAGRRVLEIACGHLGADAAATGLLSGVGWLRVLHRRVEQRRSRGAGGCRRRGVAVHSR